MTTEGDTISAALADIRQQLEEMRSSLNQLSLRGSDTHRYLTVTHAARFSDLSEESIRRLITAQKLVAHRPVRGRLLIDRIELENLIKRSIQNPRKGRGRRLKNKPA